MLAVLTAVAVVAAPQLSSGPYPFNPNIYPRYSLDAAITPDRKAMEIHGSVSVPATALGPGDLTISLSERVQHLSFTAIDERGAAHPVSATAIADPAVPAELRRWRLAFSERNPIGGSTRLRFSYRLPGTSSTIYAITPEVAFAGGLATAWYPQIINKVGSRSLGLGELRLAVPKSFIVVDASRVRAGVFRVSIDRPGYVDFVAGPYRVVRSRSGGVEMHLLKSHPRAHDFPARLDAVISALVDEFGPFPRKRFSLVEVPTGVARSAGFDGASLDGFILTIGSYFDQPFSTAFFGHELSHQWWGGLIRRRGTNGAYLLDEALAQFGSLRAVERIDGPRVARQYRLEGYPGYYAEYSGFGFLSRSLEGIDAPLAKLPVENGFLSRRVANTKGMFVWNTLAREFGRRRFADFLTGFATRNAYERITFDDFLSELRKFAGERATLLSQWFDTTGVPDIRMRWRMEGANLRVILEQEGRAFDLQVPIEIHLATGERHRVDVRLSSGHYEQVFPLGDVVAVTLDPEYEILRWTEPFRKKALAIAPYTRADIKLNYGKNEEARSELESALRSLPAGGDPYALRFRLIRGLGDAAFGDNKWDLAISRYCEAGRLPLRAEEQMPELWQGLSQAWLRKNNEARAAEAFEDAAASIRQLLGPHPTSPSPAERRRACRQIGLSGG